MMNAAELAGLRTQAETSFTSEATVHRRTQVADTSGGFTDTYSAVASYPCSFAKQPTRPFERENSPRIQLIAAWTFTFATDTDIRSTDQLLVGTRQFEVIEAGVGSADVVLKAICMEIT